MTGADETGAEDTGEGETGEAEGVDVGVWKQSIMRDSKGLCSQCPRECFFQWNMSETHRGIKCLRPPVLFETNWS